ncbi:MAG: hypothetical protein V4724_26845 [Pseudomonadota bacterium]
MSKILFIVDMQKIKDPYPDDEAAAVRAWLSFERNNVSTLSKTLLKKRTSANAWLLDSENALPDLLTLTDLAKTHGLAYKSFLISGEVVELSAAAPRTASSGPLPI